MDILNRVFPCHNSVQRYCAEQWAEQLEEEGKQKGDKFRANKTDNDGLVKELADISSNIAKLANVENDRLKYSSTISQLTERIETLKSVTKDWEKSGKKRLAEVTKILDKESFAAEARKQLTKLEKELAKLGYDTSAHEVARHTVIDGQIAEEEFNSLKSAHEVNKQIESEIANLESEIANRKSEIANLDADYQTAKTNLESAEALSPDLNKVERELFALREDENRTRDQVGAACQKVDVLATLRGRKKDYDGQREELNQQIVRHKTLERAFGKDGVPADQLGVARRRHAQVRALHLRRQRRGQGDARGALEDQDPRHHFVNVTMSAAPGNTVLRGGGTFEVHDEKTMDIEAFTELSGRYDGPVYPDQQVRVAELVQLLPHPISAGDKLDELQWALECAEGRYQASGFTALWLGFGRKPEAAANPVGRSVQPS